MFRSFESQKVCGDLEAGEKVGADTASQGVMSKSDSSSEEPDVFRLQAGERPRMREEAKKGWKKRRKKTETVKGPKKQECLGCINSRTDLILS